MTRQRTAVVITAILALLAFGAYYLMHTPDPAPGIVATIIAGIAGLGGYEVRKRSQGNA